MLNNWYIFDHLAYQCYKVHVQGWSERQVPSAAPLEDATCEDQQRLVQPTMHVFMWARGDCAPSALTTRFFDFHLDRSGRAPKPEGLCVRHGAQAA